MFKLSKHKVPLPIVKAGEYSASFGRMVTQKYPLAGESLSCEPFFIVGCGRSGNTLLRSMLCAGGDVVIPPESYVFPRIIRRFTGYNYLPWDMLASMVVSEFEAYKEFNTWGVNLYEAHQGARALTGKKRTLANIIDIIYQNYADELGKTNLRWGDKTPINTLYIDKIAKTFPTAKFIHILRDPRATTASYLKAGLLNSIEDATNFWVESNLKVEELRRHERDKICTINYECLVREPEKILKSVCSHINLSYDNEMLDFWKTSNSLGDIGMRKHHKNTMTPLSKKSVEKWKEELTSSQLKKIKKIINDRKLNCMNTYKSYDL